MEPWDKVILYGVFDGMNLSSDGSRDILVTLENGDRVDIPEYFTRKASDFIEKDKLKLKDVIARIKKLDLGTQEVWVNEILNELGGDYGSLKYRAGYEQGRFDSAMEREKVTVPQFVADFITEQKKLGHTLSYSIDACMSDRVAEWYWDNSELFARAWLDGYEVEKEPKYTVKIKAVNQYLVRNTDEDFLGFLQSRLKSKFTRKELEEAGFGWVFDCPGIEIEEVEE
jgi:hypothetical protein